MNERKLRVTIIPPYIYSEDNYKNISSFIESINKTIEQIDNDVSIQQSSEQAEMKKNRINQFTNLKRKEFHKEIINTLTDPSGTKFLIFKN